MQRNAINHSLTIHLPNPVQPLTYGFPVTLTQIIVVTDGDKQVGQALQNVVPIVSDDMTPEVLAAVNAQLAQVGLVLGKIPG